MGKNRVLLVYPNETLVGVAPSNLAILSACLKGAGFDVKLFDCSMYRRGSNETQDNVRALLGQVKKAPLDDYVRPYDDDLYDAFYKMCVEYDPCLVGFSVVDSTITFSYSMVEKIKSLNIPIMFGGVGTLFNYEKILRSGNVDIVCIGEGEGAIVDVAMAIINNKDYSHIDNICVIRDGDLIINKKRKLVDLDNIPTPDFSIYEHNRFYRPFMGKIVRMAQVDLDRGCPFSCTYCIAPSLKEMSKSENCGNYYRTKSTDKVFNEIKDLILKHDINFLWISSETFLFVNLEKFKKFANRYINEISLPFWCQNRLDMFTEEKTELLYKMGCKAVSVGLEHGSEKIRKNILNKHISNEKILESVRVLSKYDIVPTINSMLGLPDETREDVFETVEMNRKIYNILKGKQTLNVFTFIPFSGTKLRQVCIDKGYISGDEDIGFSFQGRSMLTMPSMSKEEIYGLEKTLTLYIRLPHEYWEEIRIAESSGLDSEIAFNKLSKIASEY